MSVDSPSLVELRPISWDVVEAIAQGERLDGWAEDFPDGGDVVIAGLLQRGGPERLAPVWGHHQVIERDSGLVVGGAGFFGPPQQGQTEIGYGIVPSRQGRGYATEAIQLLAALAWRHGALELTAKTDLDNPASQRVLEKAAFALIDDGAQRTYRLTKPT